MRFETYPFEKLTLLLEDVTPNPDLDPIVLTIGEPQFDTPAFIAEALCEHAPLLKKYPKTAGEAALREAMRGFVKHRFHIELDDSQIIPTFGTRELLFNFPQFLLADKPSPKMAYTNPFYQIYEGAAIAAGARVLHLNLTKENRFLPVMDEKALSGCDLVILNFPNNPTASVMPMEELVKWVKLALKHGFVLLNDECYSEIYTHTPPPSVLQASVEAGNPAFKNVLAINSVSKRSSAPGLRSGFIAGDDTILRDYMRYRTYVGCASPLPLQMAAAAAWRDNDHVAAFREKYRENFAVAREVLGIAPPEATFYIWLEVGDELAFTRRLYEEKNVKVLPGSFLGREGIGQGYVRIALVENVEKTLEACRRIAAVL
ncbi:succinyldiaminopimelate transaminase [Hydrogenimonas sp. SS33]|uniref:succinyldiaminopimelate transaminase n=1 Tax=Hydrogenimonas leucolamina TaxID=2954236 RepID=UPI00336BB63E